MNAPANVERQTNDEPYVIRKGASFYKPNFAGYTSHIEAAGIYSKEQALAVAEDRRSYAGATPPHEVSAQPLSDYTLVIEEASRLLAEKRAALGMTPLVTLDAAPTTDDAEEQIATRHRLDAFWFTGGLHDPNSYVVMAHRDRGALLERLRALRTGEGVRTEHTPADVAHTMAEYAQVADVVWYDRPAFEVRAPGGHVFQVFANGQTKGFPAGCSIFNRIPGLLSLARAASNPGTITIPKAAYDWLMGEGPDENGDHFGCVPVSAHEGAYWWRTTFRRMCGR